MIDDGACLHVIILRGIRGIIRYVKLLVVDIWRAIRIDLTLSQLTRGIWTTVSDYEILSQHFVRLIHSDSWVIPDRSVIQIFKEIHVLTHFVPPTTSLYLMYNKVLLINLIFFYLS